MPLSDPIPRYANTSGITHGTGSWSTAAGAIANNSGELLVARLLADGEADDTFEGSALTLTGAVLTWQPVTDGTTIAQTLTSQGWAYGQKWFYAIGNGGAAETLTADAGAFSIHRYALVVNGYTGYNAAAPFRQVKVGGDADGDGAFALTFDAAPLTTSVIEGAAVSALNGSLPTGIGAGASWTEDFESVEANWQIFQSQWRRNYTGTSVDWTDLSEGTGGAQSGAVAIAVEIAEAAGPTATITQAAARWRDDNGSESGAAWLAAQSVNVYRASDLATRIRFALQAALDPATAAFQLEFRIAGGSWAAVPGTPTAASVTFGAIGTGAAGTTSCAPTFPTGISATTSELFCVVTGRSNTANTAPTMPAGWTNVADLEGGTGTWGVDAGTRRVTIFRKDTVTGSETGTVTVSLAGTTANTLYASIVRVERPAGHTLDVAASTGADTTSATSFSVTGSTSVSWAAGDLLLYGIAQSIDTATHSAQSVTATGVTFGTRTNHRSTAVTNGNDHRHLVESVPVTTGSGSSAPTYAATLSVAGSGPAAFLRLRSVPPVQTIRLKASANIAAAAATATTQQLAGGTGTFLAGRISDDTNPLPTLDLGTDGCTEVEWCIEANSAGVTNGQTYEFRVTKAGTALDAYTFTPALTVGSEPPFSWPALVRRPPTLFRRH